VQRLTENREKLQHSGGVNNRGLDGRAAEKGNGEIILIQRVRAGPRTK